MTAIVNASVAEPVVKRRLRRRPPPAIRSGRVMLLAIAGYGIVGLGLVILGILIGVKGAIGALVAVVAVTVPLVAVMVGVVRLTRTRQRWAWALAVGVGAIVAVLVGYLIITMQTRTSDPNSTFFAQLALAPALVFALTSVYQFVRGAAWFNGEREHPLRPDEAGARPIDAPLLGGGPGYVAPKAASADADLAGYGARFLAYLVDSVIVGIAAGVPLVLGLAVGPSLGGGIGSLVSLIGILVATAIGVAYLPYFWVRGGQTPGMRLTHIKVALEFEPGPMSWPTAIKRLIVYAFGAAAIYLGWLWVFVDPRRKAWHDIAADTVVVDESWVRTGVAPDHIPADPALAEADAASSGTPSAIVMGALAEEAAKPAHVLAGQPLLVVEGLKKHFPIYGGILRRQIGTVYAVDGVDFEIMPGETFSLVGESGCGKTTLGRTVVQLTPSTDGRVVFDGYELADVDPDDMRPLRRRMQIIFQDPFGSLNPRMPVSDIIGEGLLSQGLTDRVARDKRVEDSLEIVGLRREYTRRYPHEFSGGQRQRIGVARALALSPDFIVADEPVSALDVSIQSQVLNLLLDLKRELHLTYLFISHNLSVVQYFSDRVGVMYLGKIVEIGTVEQLYRDPRHPYTVALLSAIPEADPRRRKSRLVLRGDVPSPAAPPAGCRFHTRCWLRERLGNPENCSTIEPPLRPFGQEGHRVACHWAEDVSATTVAKAADETPPIAAVIETA